MNNLLIKTAMEPIVNLMLCKTPVSDATPQQLAGISLLLLGGLGCMVSGHTLASVVATAEGLAKTATIYSIPFECVVLDPTSTTSYRVISIYDLETMVDDFVQMEGYGLTYHDYLSLVQAFADGTVTGERIIKIILDK